MKMASSADVVVVGGGPAGLSAAIALRSRGVESVVVLEREAEAGGIPRHTDHLGYGMRDLHRVMSGPRYAERLRLLADRAGVVVRTHATAVEWLGPQTVQVAEPTGLSAIAAGAVVLATGVRERPRAARLIPGDRGSGIFTTGSLQQLTAQHGQRPGTRAVIVGAEHVSFSAVLTLRHAGCDVLAMTTPLPRHQTFRLLSALTAGRHRVPILTNCEVAAIHGRQHVQAVTLTNGRRMECDTVVFTGDWIPDHELARRGGVTTDLNHRGPETDGSFRTNRAGVFAIGNLVHPAETADVCALDGAGVAKSVVDWLAIGDWPQPPLRLTAEPPIAWVSPSHLHVPATTMRDRINLRVASVEHGRHIDVTQGSRRLWHGKAHGRLIPNRSISIPSTWLASADPNGPNIVVSVRR